MWVEANSPSVLCDWEVGVTIVFIVLIVLTSLMPHILAFFINSSLALVLRFRRRFVSVCNVLKGIKVHGFSEARVAALGHRWHAVVRMGPAGPVTSFDPWTHWIPPHLHGFHKCAMDTLALLKEFVLKVVRHRQTSRFQAWSNWIREDLTSHPYQWLRPEFFPPAPYLVCTPEDTPDGSGILVQPALIDAHFRKAWMPYFRRDGHPVVTPQAFLDFVRNRLPQETLLDLPILTGEELYDVAMAKKSTAGGLDGWAWNEIKALSLSWFVGLALVLRPIEAAGTWPQGLLDAFIAMIPKAEGDSTSLGQRPLCVLPVVHRLWASVRLAHLKDWFCSWVPDSVFSAGKGVSSVDAWYATSLDIKKILSHARHSDFHIFVADVVKSFDTVDTDILDCALGRLGLPAWFRRVYFSFHREVRLRFKLAATLGVAWKRDGAFSQAALLVWFLLLRFMSLGVDTWSRLLMFLPNSMLIISSAPLMTLTLYWLLHSIPYLVSMLWA